ncbi:hypothetical protein BG003_008947, partial [Podila horticola]
MDHNRRCCAAFASGAPTNNNGICTTQQCVLAAADIIRDMRPDVDPCVDFNQGGGFIDTHDIQPSESQVESLFSYLSKSNRAVIRKLADPNSPSAPKAAPGDEAAANIIKKMQAAYVSCMNVDKIASVGRRPLQEDILKLVEMFPVSDSALATKSAVVPASPNIDKQNLATTLAYFNPDKTILTISENGLGLYYKGNYADVRITSVYQTTIASMFNLILGDGPQNSTSATVPASWTNVAKDVYAFEKSLADVGSSPEEMMDPILS